MNNIKQVRLDTFVEVHICDPFPTSKTTLCAPDLPRKQIVANVAQEYGDVLIGIIIYDRNIIIVDGVKYTSDKLNVQPWTKGAK